jgi:hypothetical protein
MGLLAALMYRMWCVWKFALRCITGTTELERICGLQIPPHERTLLLEKYFRRSRQLAVGGLGARLALLPAWEDKKAVAADVLRAKRIAKPTPEVVAALEESLRQMITLSQLVAALDIARKPYDSENVEHEFMLMRLWKGLRPNVLLSSRKCEEWNEIGFQGRDPATDFRGMGLLGLTNMLELVDRYTQSRAWSQQP